MGNLKKTNFVAQLQRNDYLKRYSRRFLKKRRETEKAYLLSFLGKQMTKMFAVIQLSVEALESNKLR